jgi:MATE family multidrug resistance protein
MIGLAIPGMVMVEAEYLAFEVMIIASSRFGADYLAAQSILAALATISFQIPFSMSIAASTRVATLIGAGSIDHGKVAAKTVRCPL